MKSKLRVSVTRIILIVLSAFNPGLNGVFAGEKSVESVAAKLQRTQFQLLLRVAEIPSGELVSAGMLRPNETLAQFMADPRGPFEGTDYITWRLPQAQLIFAGISNDCLIVCYLRGAGRLSRNCVVIHRGAESSKIVFRAKLLRPFVRLDELIRLLNDGDFQEVSASGDFWFRKPVDRGRPKSE